MLCTHMCADACVCMCGVPGLRWSFPPRISTSFSGVATLNITQRVSLGKFSCPACPGNPVSTTLAWQSRGPEVPNSSLSCFYAKGFSHQPASPLSFFPIKIFLKPPLNFKCSQGKKTFVSICVLLLFLPQSLFAIMYLQTCFICLTRKDK